MVKGVAAYLMSLVNHALERRGVFLNVLSQNKECGRRVLPGQFIEQAIGVLSRAIIEG
jgi:hypothetical protein